MKKTAIIFLSMVIMMITFGCSIPQNNQPSDDLTVQTQKGALTLPSQIGSRGNQSDYDSFALQAKSPEQAWENFGLATSPYYSAVTVSGINVPIYCTPVYLQYPSTSNDSADLHSFGTVYLNESDLPAAVSIETNVSMTDCVVLPQKTGVAASVGSGTITATIDSFGKFTFTPNGAVMKPLTLNVEKTAENYIIKQEDYTIKVFKAGLHYVESIDIESDNTVIYLERGAYLAALQPLYIENPIVPSDANGKTRWKGFINANGKNNIKIIGDGAYIDFTNLDIVARAPMDFRNCDGLEISGVTILNSPVWNITPMFSKNILIDNVKIFGYRTSSDGIEIVNCENVVVKNSFIRSGDDLYGVKSMSASALGGKNILFENNQAWPDKVRGYGILHETQSDISDVTFRDCSVLFRYSNWMDELGSLAIIVGDAGTISNITFENIEIYYDVKYPIILAFKKDEYSHQLAYGRIENIYFKNISYNSHANTEIRMNALDASAQGNIKDIYFDNITKNGTQITSVNDLKLKLAHVLTTDIYLNTLG